MGTGDWNDGMNKVGAEGRGESVWNGWFFLTVLRSFAPICVSRGDLGRAEWCQERAESLRMALEATAWDGAWYRRAYFDDGTPLGSSENDECQIDAIPQAWAVISGVADHERASQAMNSVYERLVREEDKLIALFDPRLTPAHCSRAISRATSPASGRMAASIHMQLYGWSGRLPYWARGSRRSALEHAQSDLSWGHKGSGRAVQSRALYSERRRLQCGSAHGARRVDLVHGVSGLDVQSGAGGNPRSAASGSGSSFSTLCSPIGSVERYTGSILTTRRGSAEECAR
jgi:Glycosyl hydrolase 36 superfamily, catalytic domain